MPGPAAHVCVPLADFREEGGDAGLVRTGIVCSLFWADVRKRLDRIGVPFSVYSDAHQPIIVTKGSVGSRDCRLSGMGVRTGQVGNPHIFLVGGAQFPVPRRRCREVGIGGGGRRDQGEKYRRDAQRECDVVLGVKSLHSLSRVLKGVQMSGVKSGEAAGERDFQHRKQGEGDQMVLT